MQRGSFRNTSSSRCRPKGNVMTVVEFPNESGGFLILIDCNIPCIPQKPLTFLYLASKALYFLLLSLECWKANREELYLASEAPHCPTSRVVIKFRAMLI